METFKVFHFDPNKDKPYKYMVLFLTNSKRPYDLITEIEQKLKEMDKGSGSVLFDLVLIGSDKTQRYIFSYFDGVNIELDSFGIQRLVPKIYVDVVFKFLSDNYQYVKNSFLPNLEKSMFLKKKKEIKIDI